MFRKAVIGGTFDYLHLGHRKILETGFHLSKEVVIGLTSDEFARRFRVEPVSPYEKRKKALEKFIKKFQKPYRIMKIEDSYGIATLDPDIDSIIVSEETLVRAEEINAIRFKKSLNKLTIVVEPILLAENGRALSSDRISRGEIDKEGKLLK